MRDKRPHGSKRLTMGALAVILYNSWDWIFAAEALRQPMFDAKDDAEEADGREETEKEGEEGTEGRGGGEEEGKVKLIEGTVMLNVR